MPITNKKVRLFQGKPLLVGGKVAVSDNCCCGAVSCAGCSLPAGNCPHAFCIEFKLDSNDSSNRDLIEINAAATNQIGFYYDQAGNWQLYAAGTGPQLVIPAMNPLDTWHSAMIQTTRIDADNIHIVLTVDGDTAEGDFSWVGSAPAANIRVGALQGDSNPVHRTFRCAVALGNPTLSEGDFIFPASSFDSLTSGASIDADGFLRIDHGAVAVDDYAQKNLSTVYHLTCNAGACCDGETCTITTAADCATTFLGVGTDCDPNPCCLDTKAVSISGITFCTDCIFLALNHGFKISDDTIISGSPWTLGGGSLISHGCIACGWDSLSLVTQPNIKVHDYANGACTGSPTDFNDAPIIIAARIDGLYYCFVYAGYGGVLFFLFYGSNSDPSSISNSLSGCATSLTINDRFTDCVFGSGTPGSGWQFGRVMGTGGTASIS